MGGAAAGALRADNFLAGAAPRPCVMCGAWFCAAALPPAAWGGAARVVWLRGRLARHILAGLPCAYGSAVNARRAQRAACGCGELPGAVFAVMSPFSYFRPVTMRVTLT